MSAPPTKPWERVGVNNQSQAGSTLNNQMSSSDLPSASRGGTGLLDTVRPIADAQQRPQPLVPPRPSLQGLSSMSYGGLGTGGGMYGGFGGLGGYNSMYSPYGSSMYGGTGSMYGGYGSYGGMNNFGNNFTTNSFARMAEENSRQAFQSIEGIVQAFGAVAMMLESTYSAVYNSFRAVIGVADHFSRMRTHFAQIFSAFAVIKSLRWLVRKLLVLLRLRGAVPDEELWTQASKIGEEAAASIPGSKKPTTSWPLLLFFAVIVGGPWLIWRFLSSLSSSSGMGSGWSTGKDDHFVAVAEFDFDGEKDDELSFRRGQRINVAPKELQPRMRGWLMASVEGKIGIIPANYVKILGKRRGAKEAARGQHSAATLPPPGGNVLTTTVNETGPQTFTPSQLNEDSSHCISMETVFEQKHEAHDSSDQLNANMPPERGQLNSTVQTEGKILDTLDSAKESLDS